MNSEGEEVDIDEEELPDGEAIRRLEESFIKIKERKYEVQPNVINADYCLKRLAREDADSYDDGAAYADNTEYMVYSEKQFRIRYLVEFKMII